MAIDALKITAGRCSGKTETQGLVLASLVQPEASQARDLVLTNVVLARRFTPGLNQVTWFGSKSCSHRLIVVHAGLRYELWQINMASNLMARIRLVICFETKIVLASWFWLITLFVTFLVLTRLTETSPSRQSGGPSPDSRVVQCIAADCLLSRTFEGQL